MSDATRFAAALERARGSIHATFGAAALFLPAGGEPFAITPIENRADREIAASFGRAFRPGLTLRVIAAEITQGAGRRPRAGDMVMIDGAAWVVRKALLGDPRAQVFDLELEPQE